MLITRVSRFSGKEVTKDLNVTQTELVTWETGVPAQEASRFLSASDREFIMTGTTQEEWNLMFPPEAGGEAKEEGSSLRCYLNENFDYLRY